MGIREIIFRLLARQRGHRKDIHYIGPIAAIASGPLAVFVLMIWGEGVHWFYIYQEGYKLFFHQCNNHVATRGNNRWSFVV